MRNRGRMKDKCYRSLSFTKLFLGLIFLFMLSSSSRTELGDILSELDCVFISWHGHVPSWIPGFLCLVEGEDVLINGGIRIAT